MTSIHAIDEARLSIMLNELRLPTIKIPWQQFAEHADREGWPAARFLSAIAEHDLAERHLAEAHLPPGKTLDSFAFDAVPMISKAQVMAIAAGGSCQTDEIRSLQWQDSCPLYRAELSPSASAAARLALKLCRE